MEAVRMMNIKLDNEQQEQVIKDLKSHEIPEELFEKVAGGISFPRLPIFPTTWLKIEL